MYSLDQLHADLILVGHGLVLAALMATPWMLWMALAP
jgi:hypothetical protein